MQLWLAEAAVSTMHGCLRLSRIWLPGHHSPMLMFSIQRFTITINTSNTTILTTISKILVAAPTWSILVMRCSTCVDAFGHRRSTTSPHFHSLLEAPLSISRVAVVEANVGVDLECLLYLSLEIEQRIDCVLLGALFQHSGLLLSRVVAIELRSARAPPPSHYRSSFEDNW